MIPEFFADAGKMLDGLHRDGAVTWGDVGNVLAIAVGGFFIVGASVLLFGLAAISAFLAGVACFRKG